MTNGERDRQMAGYAQRDQFMRLANEDIHAVKIRLGREAILLSYRMRHATEIAQERALQDFRRYADEAENALLARLSMTYGVSEEQLRQYMEAGGIRVPTQTPGPGPIGGEPGREDEPRTEGRRGWFGRR